MGNHPEHDHVLWSWLLKVGADKSRILELGIQHGGCSRKVTIVIHLLADNYDCAGLRLDASMWSRSRMGYYTGERPSRTPCLLLGQLILMGFFVCSDWALGRDRALQVPC